MGLKSHMYTSENVKFSKANVFHINKIMEIKRKISLLIIINVPEIFSIAIN